MNETTRGELSFSQ